MQFGGQTPLKLAAALEAAGMPILGTSPDAIDLAEDRERFQQLLNKLGLRQPENGTARSPDEAEKIAERIGYPVVIRPSYVLGGRAMEIVHDVAGAAPLHDAPRCKVSGDNPVLIDSYLQRRDRGRCRRARRRHRRLRRRHHGAYRGGRHPFRRQRLLAAALLRCRRSVIAEIERADRSRWPRRSTSSA